MYGRRARKKYFNFLRLRRCLDDDQGENTVGNFGIALGIVGLRNSNLTHLKINSSHSTLIRNMDFVVAALRFFSRIKRNSATAQQRNSAPLILAAFSKQNLSS
jgi:hypothetical protein